MSVSVHMHISQTRLDPCMLPVTMAQSPGSIVTLRVYGQRRVLLHCALWWCDLTAAASL